MNINFEIVLDNIKKIRKLQKRSIHDCATFLNISRGTYLKFEQGQTSLSLPEIELLAHHFGVPVDVFFQPEFEETVSLPLLDKEIHPGYTQLRNKMISAQLNVSLAEQKLDLSQLHEVTQIPLEDLRTYFNASQPIPLDHYILLHETLHLPDQIGYKHDQPPEAPSETHQPIQQQTDDQKQIDNPGEIASANDFVLQAFHQMPVQDQAEIAKTILQKIKES